MSLNTVSFDLAPVYERALRAAQPGEIPGIRRAFRRALRAARALQFGTVWINDHIPLVSEMPHGGYKESGYGKDLSMYGFEDYTRIKHVMSYIGD